MTKSKTDNSGSVEIINMDWMGDLSEQIGEQIDNPLKDYRFIKVYNPMMGIDPDPTLDGQLLEYTSEGEKLAIGGTIDGIKVLALTKCYEGFGNRLDENGNIVKDSETNKPIQDHYFTPEVSVYDKSNIAIARRDDKGVHVLGMGNYESYSKFTTTMQKEDGTINPMFNEIKTNQTTGEKYPTSIFRQNRYLYFKMGDGLFKMKLGASYGNWKVPEPGTFIAVENKAKESFKASGKKIRFQPFFMTISGSVKAADKYKYIEWKFHNITTENISSDIIATQEAIKLYNETNFKGLDISNPVNTLDYSYNNLILDTTEKVGTILDASDAGNVFDEKPIENPETGEKVPW